MRGGVRGLNSSAAAVRLMAVQENAQERETSAVLREVKTESYTEHAIRQDFKEGKPHKSTWHLKNEIERMNLISCS